MDALIATWNAMLAWAVPAGAGGLGAHAASLDMTHLVALAAAVGWASGLRLYLVVFVCGLAGALGWIALPAGLQVLQHPAMLAAGGFMLFVEFFADKIPGVDSLWDIVHSVIRVPAGAMLAAGVFGADSATMAAVAGLLGGALAATSFATKASTRAAVNTSPEPFSNIAVSLSEDGLVLGALWLAMNYPLAFGVCLAVALVLSAWLLVVLLKYLAAVLRRLRGWLGGGGIGNPASS